MRTAICKLNERLWAQKRAQRNIVTPLTIAVLLFEVHGEGAGDAIVKRVWSMRECLTLFDWSDSDNDSLRELLLQCFAKPLLTRNADNRRVLASILSQCPALVAEAHAFIRLQLTNGCGARAQEGWGEVYYKAWAGAEAGARIVIEQAAIQDLMARGTRAAQPSTFAAVRRVLAALVERKQSRAKGVEAMLLRLYSPILFRALAASNAAMRTNAAILLLDAFPLRDPDLPQAEGDKQLEAQFTALTGLLLDPSPGVREVGVTGIAKVLGEYWELIPPAVAKTLLSRLVDDCAHDAAAPAVRAAVPTAIAELVLVQPLSHPLLAGGGLLRSLGDLLNDRSEKVSRDAWIGCLAVLRR